MTQESLVERTSFSLGTQVAVVLGSNRKLSQNVMTSRVCVYVWLKRGENFAEKEKRMKEEKDLLENFLTEISWETLFDI